MPHVLPISVFLTWSPEWYLVRSTEHEAPCYAVFSTPPSAHPSWAQISSSTPFFWVILGRYSVQISAGTQRIFLFCFCTCRRHWTSNYSSFTYFSF
jgi:hypothetical protein